MQKKLFFNSSLPRSGSTLIQNVLGQNPDIYVTPTSGVLELIYGARHNYSNAAEFKAQDSELMKKAFLNFCKNGLYSYFDAITEKPICIDKSRGWSVNYDFAKLIIGEEPKMICMVRDLREVLCSMEKNFRKNQHKSSGIVNNVEMKGTTTPKRVDIWMNSQPVGLAVERLSQVIREGNDKKILFIRFEDLCENPEFQLKRIYSYLNLPFYQHDFNKVEQITQEDDEVYGIFGDHKIRQEIKPVEKLHSLILGNDVSNWVYTNYKWFFDYFGYGA